MGSTNDLDAALFGLWDGTFLRSPINTRVCTEPRAGSGEGAERLYILVEAVDASMVSPALYDRTLSAIALGYMSSEGTVEHALDAALCAANEMLFQRNLRADGAHQVVMGLEAAVETGNEVTIGQLGPVSLCGALAGRPLLVPADSPWSGAAMAEAETPAGLRRQTVPRLYRAALAAGDVLALATTNLTRGMPTWDLVPILARGAEEAHARLAPLGRDENWCAIVLAAGEANVADLRADAAALILPEEISLVLPASDSPVAESSETPELDSEDLVPAAGPSGVSRETGDGDAPDHPVEDSADQAQAPIEVSEPAVNALGSGSGAEAASPDAQAVDASEEPWEGEPWAGADESAWAATAPEPGELPAPVPAGRAERAPRQSALRRSLARLVYQMEDVLVKVLPDKMPQRPESVPASKRRITWGGRALVLLAMAIPVVMLGVVIMTRVQYEDSRRDQFGDYQSRAQSLYDQATTSENLAATRQGLADALIATDEGLSINPGDEMLMSLKRRIEHQMDQINAVERIYTFYKLADLDEGATGSGDASRIVVQGIDLYVLHRGSDRVTRYLMNDVGDALQPVGGDPTLLRTGELVGGVSVGDVVDMAWMRAGGQRTLDTFVMLDRTGTMFAYDPQVGIEALPVADAATWIKPEAIGGYFGNLYVLDPLLNAILKYIPTDNSYTSPPTSYLNPMLGVDLTGAVDMAVDGNLYVLFANGEVLKFYEGERAAFALNGLPSPMRSPSAIFVSGEQEPTAEGFVYIADTGNQRVLQFDKDGNYVRQLKAKLDGEEMQGLRGLWVDEKAERILLVSDSALWYAKLPALGAR